MQALKCICVCSCVYNIVVNQRRDDRMHNSYYVHVSLFSIGKEWSILFTSRGKPSSLLIYIYPQVLSLLRMLYFIAYYHLHLLPHGPTFTLYLNNVKYCLYIWCEGGQRTECGVTQPCNSVHKSEYYASDVRPTPLDHHWSWSVNFMSVHNNIHLKYLTLL